MRTIGLMVIFVSALGAGESLGSVPGQASPGGQVAVRFSLLEGMAEMEGDGGPSIRSDTLPDATSVFDGVYSAIQASNGEEMFERACESCHQSGEFTGPRFRFRWRDASVGDIYELISTDMPKGDPGTLSAEEYASIVAYFLSMNGYPHGDHPLPSDPSILGDLRFARGTD